MRTFEYRLRPNVQQAQTLMAILRTSRTLYNDGLEELIAHYQETGKHMHLYEQDKRHGKAQHPDLPAVVVDTVLKRLHRSFGNFFHGQKDGRALVFLVSRAPTPGTPFSSATQSATSKAITFMRPNKRVASYVSTCIARWKEPSSLDVSSFVHQAGISNASVKRRQRPCHAKTMQLASIWAFGI